MIPFLDCNIWSVFPDNHNVGYFFVYRIYHHNSMQGNFNLLDQYDCVQVPESLIENLGVLNKLDTNLINEHRIPILKKYDSVKWKIDLEHYEQYSSIQ